MPCSNSSQLVKLRRLSLSRDGVGVEEPEEGLRDEDGREPALFLRPPDLAVTRGLEEGVCEGV